MIIKTTTTIVILLLASKHPVYISNAMAHFSLLCSNWFPLLSSTWHRAAGTSSIGNCVRNANTQAPPRKGLRSVSHAHKVILMLLLGTLAPGDLTSRPGIPAPLPPSPASPGKLLNFLLP